MKKSDSVHRAIGKAIDFVLVGMLSLIPRVGILAAGLYILIGDGFFNGQSVGKKLVGLRVVLADPGHEGERCSFRQSLIRNLPYAVIVVLGSIPIFGWFIVLPLGVLFLAVEAYFVWADDRGVRVGDIYAGTQVIDDQTSG
ncbi:MAG: RDD family protein [Pseudomonadota bacterium]